MHDVVRQQYHPLMGCMPRLPALGRAGRGIAKKTLGTVAVRLAAAAVLTLVSVAPAWAAAAVNMPTAPRRYPGALPYHLDVGGLDGRLGWGDLGADDPTPRLVAQTSGAPATAGATAAEPDGPEESASELNRKLTNPVSSLWSITNQFNNFKLADGHWNNNWNFQPVLPVSLTRDVNLITRPVMPFYNIVPHATASGQFERTAGLGDLALLELLSPAHSGHWVLGAGPTFIFPTATRIPASRGC